MPDYRSIQTGGWFQTDGNVPEFQEVFTDGWFNQYTELAAPVIVVAVMDLGLMHNMGIGFGR